MQIDFVLKLINSNPKPNFSLEFYCIFSFFWLMIYGRSLKLIHIVCQLAYNFQGILQTELPVNVEPENKYEKCRQ